MLFLTLFFLISNPLATLYVGMGSNCKPTMHISTSNYAMYMYMYQAYIHVYVRYVKFTLTETEY